MTPSMNTGAPKGTQAPAAGLAAIAQPAQAPKGKSPENMSQIMALARKMSDAQLADVLQGKSLDVPQFAAMTEAMGRKSLRTAVQGQQAMAQAKQPSLKDKLMAEQQAEMMPQMQGIQQGMPQMTQQPVMAAEGGLMYADGGAIDMNEGQAAGGLAELPAPNMQYLTMAEGGIIAFNGEKGSEVEDPEKEQARKDRNAFKYGWENTKAAARDILTLPGRGVAGAFETAVTRPVRAMGIDMPYLPSSFYGGDASSLTPHMDALTRQRQGNSILPASPAAINTDADTQPGYTPNVELNPAAPAKGPTQAQINAMFQKGKGAAPTEGAQPTRSQAEQDYLAKLAGLGEKTRGGISDIKNQAQSQVFLDLSSALLGNRNLTEAGSKAGQLIAGRVGAMGKDMRSAEKEANEYDLNVAKARAAFEAGDKDRAFKYQQAADENKYRMAMVNKPDSGIALLNALKDPKMMELYQQMNMAKKPTDTLDRDKAAALWEKITRREKADKYGNDFETYYRTMNNQLMVNSPGQGANVIGSLT
jgi:hypothetical protein